MTAPTHQLPFARRSTTSVVGCRGARITAFSDREFTTIKITGDIDACNVDDLTNLARDAVPDGAALILDLAGVDFIAVAGLRTLLAVNIECARCGSSWALIVSPAVTRLLRVGDRDHTLPVVGSPVEALLQIRRARREHRHLLAVTGHPVSGLPVRF